MNFSLKHLENSLALQSKVEKVSSSHTESCVVFLEGKDPLQKICDDVKNESSWFDGLKSSAELSISLPVRLIK